MDKEEVKKRVHFEEYEASKKTRMQKLGGTSTGKRQILQKSSPSPISMEKGRKSVTLEGRKSVTPEPKKSKLPKRKIEKQTMRFNFTKPGTGSLKKNWNKMQKTKEDSFLDSEITLKIDPRTIARRRSTLSMYSNFDVVQVLSGIQDQQKSRKQTHIEEQLSAIKKRVRKSLEGVGMESDDDEDDKLVGGPAGGQVKFPPIFDTRSEREKMQERNYIIGQVERFEEKALLRKQYLTELAGWFEDNLNICHDMVTPEEMKEMMKSSLEIHKVISDALKAFMNSSDKVVDVGKLLLNETSKIIEEKKALMSKKTKKERIIVYDDKTVLSDPLKWEAGVKNIIAVFEDCQKMIKNMMFKNALRLGQRQFDYLMVAADKRYKDLDEKKKACNELQGKLHMAKIQADKMTKEIEEQKRKTGKLTGELTEAKKALEKLSERNKDMNTKIAELNTKIRFLEEELRQKMRTPTPPPTPPPPPEPEKIIVKVVDSATELQLHETEEELKKAKADIDKYLAELGALQEALKSEKDQNQQLKDKVLDLENQPAPEPVQVAVPMPVVEPVEDKDSNYYKTLMVGMKKDFNVELDKLKAHVAHERNRGEAGKRKIELQHKEQLSIIQKDVIRMLRAIMHFRDHMLTCLQKENLMDQFQALHDLGNLLKDKMSPDPKEVLQMLVSTVIDYLHNMEGILSNAFLAMKVMMKYQVDKQVEHEVQMRLAKEKQEREAKKLVKDCKVKQKEIKTASKDMNRLAKRLKKTKNKLRKYQKNFEDVAPSTDKRYNDLLQRYQLVIKMYQNMHKEMETLQSDFHTTMQRKLEERETMVISQMKTEIKQHRVLNEKQLKLSIADQKENLRLLSKAYEDNKISRELHSMATAMIKKTLEIPVIRLRNLFEQYIAYKAVEESKRRVTSMLEDKDSEINVDTRYEMTNYIMTLDSKFGESMNDWKRGMRNLESEKQELNKKIYKLIVADSLIYGTPLANRVDPDETAPIGAVSSGSTLFANTSNHVTMRFNELLLETGILLIHPLLKDKNKQAILTRAAATVTKKQMKDLLFKKRKNFRHLMGLPEGIQGASVGQLVPGVATKWFTKLPRPQSSRETNVGVAPHMLAYEVNKPRIVAQRSMQRSGNTLKPGKTESFTISGSNYLQFIRHIPYQWISNEQWPLNAGM